jgi:hypothetical protein
LLSFVVVVVVQVWENVLRYELQARRKCLRCFSIEEGLDFVSLSSETDELASAGRL